MSLDELREKAIKAQQHEYMLACRNTSGLSYDEKTLLDIKYRKAAQDFQEADMAYREALSKEHGVKL